MSWDPEHPVCTVCTRRAQCAHGVHSVHRMKSVHIFAYFLSIVHTCIVFNQYIRLCARFAPNISDKSQPLLEVSTVLETGRPHSQDTWAGGGDVGLVNWSMSRHAFPRPEPLNTIANCPLRPTTAGHPDSLRAPKSGFSFLDSDNTRWRRWIISRACISGDGVP